MNSLHLIPSIDIIFGPMYCGKTTELIRRLNIYYEMDMKVLYINSTKDTRSDKQFSTHNSTIGSISFHSRKVDLLETVKIDEYDVIGVDESQLFSNLKKTILHWVEEKQKIVLLAGLNGDFNRQPFGELISLVPYCDSLTKLTPFCLSCKNDKGEIRSAHFTKRMVENNSTVLIGGRDIYIPVCRLCFNR